MQRLYSAPILKCYLAIATLFILFIAAHYPGGMTYDSYLIFTQAINSKYQQHNSPILGLSWHYLNYLSTGPLIMLLLEQVLLWGSVALFVETLYKKNGYSKVLWIFILAPLLPAILKTSGYIWKDVIFAFSYLFCASLLARFTLLEKLRPSVFVKIIIPFLLFYGTSVKYQAMFIAPIFIFWYLMTCYKYSKKILVILTLICSLALSKSIINTNNYLAQDFNETTRTGWQEIKFFDLVYISLKKNKILLPQYLIDDPKFDFKPFKEKFTSSTIFEVMFAGNSPLTFTTDPGKQQQIRNCWNEAVLKYPLTYLQARLYRISRVLTRLIVRMPSMLYYGNEVSEGMRGYYKPYLTDNFLSKFVEIYTKAFFWTSMFALCLPFSIYYLFVGLNSYLRAKSPYGLVAFFMNFTAIAFILIMMFIAVNIDFRYLFICQMLFHFSHPFAWRAKKDLLI